MTELATSRLGCLGCHPHCLCVQRRRRLDSPLRDVLDILRCLFKLRGRRSMKESRRRFVDES
jgi:hypothetical protein